MIVSAKRIPLKNYLSRRDYLTNKACKIAIWSLRAKLDENHNPFSEEGIMFDKLTSCKLFFFLLTAIVLLNFTSSTSHADTGWKLVYEDDYKYSAQHPDNTTFNTWFWREDSVGTHSFESTEIIGCSSDTPCVKLTAPIYVSSGTIPLINSEMYNNSCVRKGIGHPEEQPYDQLAQFKFTNVYLTAYLPRLLYMEIGRYCDIPYPYRDIPTQKVTPYAKNSWNTTTKARLNPYRGGMEPEWQWFRDIVQNNLYQGHSVPTKVKMKIIAENKGGGSRGWGFWNTEMDLAIGQFAWFMEFTFPKKDKKGLFKNSVWMWTLGRDSDNNRGICITKLPDEYDIYEWHVYEVAWSKNSVEYYVDGNQVAKHTRFVPNVDLAFHNWVDNRNYNPLPPGKSNYSDSPNFQLFKDKNIYINHFAVYEKSDSGNESEDETSFKPSSDDSICISFKEIKEIEEFEEIIRIIVYIVEKIIWDLPDPIVSGR